ncbi:PREDICTED: DNA-binding protein DDB_G0278111 [Populus euphratica]|uniref:DNA-binding protein DDB_G0278111 n=1 Tax=Populus euphratica TaxID=75702 RepID=A0AAJ6X587_POPEU|nr:PREDICTED: DNA-binding protein DDB_G0278111 [Populus euphratica]
MDGCVALGPLASSPLGLAKSRLPNARPCCEASTQNIQKLFGGGAKKSKARRGRQIHNLQQEANFLDHSNQSMADPELEAIRQRRMQELMAQRGMGNPQNSEQQKAQEDAKNDAEERRQMMLSQILSSEARERLARIALVKPEKARGVEDVILRAAQMGQIVEKVSEERLISMLEQINNQTTKQTKVTIQRRRSVLDDDD